MYQKQVSRHASHLHEGRCFSWKKLLLLTFECIPSLKMNLTGVESFKMWQNIPDTLCFQRTTSGIKRIDFIRSNLRKPCQYLRIYVIKLIP